MTTLSFSLLQAAGNAGGTSSFLIMIVLMFAIMYFFMIRPQNKKQKEIQNFRNSLSKGQEVVTAGGIYGTIRDIDDVNNIITLEIANGVRVRIDRNSIYASAPTADGQQAASTPAPAKDSYAK